MGVIDSVRARIARALGREWKPPNIKPEGRTGDLKYTYADPKSKRLALATRMDSVTIEQLDKCRFYPRVRDCLNAKRGPIVRSNFSFISSNPIAADAAAQVLAEILPGLVETLVKGGMEFGRQTVEVQWAPLFDVEVTSTQAEGGRTSAMFPYMYGVKGFRSFDPRDTRLLIHPRSGKVRGIRQFVAFTNQQDVVYPNIVHYSHNPEFDLNYGVPDTKAAVPWVDTAYGVWDSMANFGARLSDPIAIVKFPEGQSIIEGKSFSNYELALQAVMALDGGSKVVLPSDVHVVAGNATSVPKWSVEFQTPPSATADFVGFLAAFDEQITLALAGVPQMAQGGKSPDSGTYNLGEIQIDEFLKNLQSILNRLEGSINEYLLVPWTFYNFGADEPPVKIQFEKLGRNIAQATLSMLLNMLASGEPVTDLDGNQLQLDYQKIAEDNGLPYRLRKGSGVQTLVDMVRQKLGDNENERTL